MARILDTGDAEDLEFEPLSDEQHAVLVGGQHALAGKSGVRLEDLMEYPWVLPPPGSVLHERLLGLFLQRGITAPANVIQTQSLQVITHLLQTTHCVAVLQLEAVRPLCECRLLSVLVENLGLAIGCFGLITRRGHRLSPGGRVLLDCLRSAAQQIYECDAALPIPNPVRRAVLHV